MMIERIQSKIHITITLLISLCLTAFDLIDHNTLLLSSSVAKMKVNKMFRLFVRALINEILCVLVMVSKVAVFAK